MAYRKRERMRLPRPRGLPPVDLKPAAAIKPENVSATQLHVDLAQDVRPVQADDREVESTLKVASTRNFQRGGPENSDRSLGQKERKSSRRKPHSAFQETPVTRRKMPSVIRHPAT